MGITIAGVTGFTVFAGKLLIMTGITAPPIVLFAVCAAVGPGPMLAFEGIAMALIVILCVIVLGQHHFAIDTTQFALSSFPASSLGLGVVVAVFSLVGFESATAFGDEAKDPLETIPRAVIMSLLISGRFFVFVCYVTVLGVAGNGAPLDRIDAPLNVLAELAHAQGLQIPLSLGAMVSFFALALSCINAGGRIILSMGRHGLFQAATARLHVLNETPHVAGTVLAGIAFVISTTASVFLIETLQLFNDAGTGAGFGFLVPYTLITVVAPVYLRAIGQLGARDIVVCVCSLGLLAIPTVGSVYPVPDAPVNAFPYAFLASLAIGLIWIAVFHRQRPAAAATILDDLRMSRDRFGRANHSLTPAE